MLGPDFMAKDCENCKEQFKKVWSEVDVRYEKLALYVFSKIFYFFVVVDINKSMNFKNDFLTEIKFILIIVC